MFLGGPGAYSPCRGCGEDRQCHETTAHAARLERGFLVMLVRPVSNVHVSQGFRHDTLAGFATLPLKKGQMGFVYVEVW